MCESIQRLKKLLENGFTPYHVKDSVIEQLLQNGFVALTEEEDWELQEGGKYFVQRDGSLIAFRIDGLDRFLFKIVASHTDSCGLKLKENFLVQTDLYSKINVEPYGGGLWYSFLDRPLKIAGRVVYEEDGALCVQTVQSPFFVEIPSQAIHFNRNANDAFSVNPQIDLLPLLSQGNDVTEQDVFSSMQIDKRVLGYDLFLVNGEPCVETGLHGEFISSPRIDNLTSVQATVDALLHQTATQGVCVGAFFNHEEVGSNTSQGAGGDFLENTLRRITFSLRFDEVEFFKAMASSFLLSVDNAHAVHPNHPEKSDITNKTQMGKGIVIKSHAKQAYATGAITSALLKSVFEKANVPYQTFYNRSDMRSGATLGNICLARFGTHGADIGLAQLAMHSAFECFAKTDYLSLIDGIKAFFATDIQQSDNRIQLQ